MKAIAIFDIDGVIRDVGGSYRRAIADTVEHFTQNAYRPTLQDIDKLKSEGIWNNDWEASRELIYRYFEHQPNSIPSPDSTESAVSVGLSRNPIDLNYDDLIAFFQSRYRGPDPNHWTGYICSEPLLCEPTYFEQLTQANIGWGFFSGAMRDEALYALTGKLGLVSPVLVAMEDAPGKPDPTGLLMAVEQLQPENSTTIVYVGDTVGDMYTVQRASEQQPERAWIGVGVLPPHVQQNSQQAQAYRQTLKAAGAILVMPSVEQLAAVVIEQLVTAN
ncbi:HAD hydrolase, IA, variant 1 family protein [Lyngbya aestuarii BL J]|uniref:HAD hydrolase, IA, variant 1 family protein n=1 Tax=Lyngbya aestuarii BL J TaxID=1348334 RepID=U7QK58_9CYAN|nr:TIGR01548 family HAD-type hydrolase [Lyngbya aestuarii]ERT07460.1 HAD hydrolase, IA, variant 1 family protein [Lyngbya aestuarii BL J]